MPDDLVTIRVLQDATHAEMYREILENEDIVAMIPGAQHRSMMGMVGSFVEIHLKVREADAERATEIIDAIETEAPEFDWTGAEESAEESAEEPKDKPEKAPEEDDESPPPTKLKRVAFFIAFAIPGGGHFYLRRWGLGALFLVTQVIAGMIFAYSGEVLLALIWIPGLVLADALGAVSRVSEINGGPPPAGPRRWLARGLGALVVLAVAAVLLVSEAAPAWTVGQGGRTVCQRMRACGGKPLGGCELGISRKLRRGETAPHWLDMCAQCLRERPCETAGVLCEAYCKRARISLDSVPSPAPLRPLRLRGLYGPEDPGPPLPLHDWSELGGKGRDRHRRR